MAYLAPDFLRRTTGRSVKITKKGRYLKDGGYKPRKTKSVAQTPTKPTGGRTPPKKPTFKSKPTRKQYAKINEAIDEGEMAYERAVNRKKVDIESLTPTERKAFMKSISRRKKGGKVLKTKVKRKTTAPRKRAALRGYGAALRGF